jgi:hypothetical protein
MRKNRSEEVGFIASKNASEEWSETMMFGHDEGSDSEPEEQPSVGEEDLPASDFAMTLGSFIPSQPISTNEKIRREEETKRLLATASSSEEREVGGIMPQSRSLAMVAKQRTLSKSNDLNGVTPPSSSSQQATSSFKKLAGSISSLLSSPSKPLEKGVEMGMVSLPSASIQSPNSAAKKLAENQGVTRESS